MKFNTYWVFFVSICICLAGACKPDTNQDDIEDPASGDPLVVEVDTVNSVITGAENLIANYLDKLRDKDVAIVANHTSRLPDGTHLVDTLLGLEIELTKVFAPEHGFRGAADAGAKIQNSTDPETGLPILSLYGKSRKPSKEQLLGIDIVIFDIQDVGTRHYTYISTMSYVMEACAEHGIDFIVLDRPNPNGSYVAGPIMQEKFSSFIGLHEIPIVHGMTIGEYAQMVKGENWIEKADSLKLEIIPCESYSHEMTWEDTRQEWIAPSPNLGTEYAAYLYPILCWFEATTLSIGRGTDDAFTIIGAPWLEFDETGWSAYGLKAQSYNFMPVSLPGKSTHPKHQDTECIGLKFENRVNGDSLFLAGLKLTQDLYLQTKENSDEEFFNRNLSTWSGNTTLEAQIKDQVPPEEILESWQEGLDSFKEIRSRYILYP